MDLPVETDAVNLLTRLSAVLSVVPSLSSDMVRTFAGLGLEGTWPRVPGAISTSGDGYLAGKTAPYRDAPARLVAATLYVFPEALIEQAVVRARSSTTPDAVWSARIEIAASVFGRALGTTTRDIEQTADYLREIVETLSISGKPAFAALAAAEWPRSRWAQIWLALECLAEHRRSVRHNAASGELTGAEYIALHAVRGAAPAAVVMTELGWPTDAIARTLSQLGLRELIIEGTPTVSALTILRELDFIARRAQREVAVLLGDRAEEHLKRLAQWYEVIAATRELADPLAGAPARALINL